MHGLHNEDRQVSPAVDAKKPLAGSKSHRLGADGQLSWMVKGLRLTRSGIVVLAATAVLVACGNTTTIIEKYLA